MCNCNPSPATICSQCAQGNTCGCPPNYAIMPAAATCGCCPPGYMYYGPTANYPAGYCQDSKLAIVPTVPCNTCDETMTSDCIMIPTGTVTGFTGTTLTQLLAFLAGP